jgi:phospholipid transport system substrate-binding protein
MAGRFKQVIVTFLFLILAGNVSAEEATANDAATEKAAQPAAELPAQGPHQLVESVTEDLLTQIDKYRDSFEQDPEPFFSALDCLLGEVVDFRWIAYNVMGPYRAQATDEQLKRFAQAFREDLIETYARGLISYGDETIVVLPPEEELGDKRRVTVAQEIHGVDGVFPLYYSMARNKQGDWKVTNVVINGINLGKTFRNQFSQRAQKYGGDIDQVIDSWTTKVETTEA